MLAKAIAGFTLFGFVLLKAVLCVRIANKTSSVVQANEVYQKTMPPLLKFIDGDPRTDTGFGFLLAGLAGFLLWKTGKLVFKIIAILAFILAYWHLFSLM